jgi:hypothetical protein
MQDTTKRQNKAIQKGDKTGEEKRVDQAKPKQDNE